MKRTTCGLVFMFLLSIVANSAYGSDGLSMLKVETGAEPSGMGGAVAAVTGSPDLIVYNPAAAADFNKFHVSLGHTAYWNDIRMESGHFAMKVSRRVNLHGGIRYAAIDELEFRGEVASEEPLGYFDAHDISAKAGLAVELTDWLSTGFSLGAVSEKIEAWHGGTFAFDFGLLARTTQNVTVGAAITNLGSDFRLSKADNTESRDIALPTTYRVGAAYQYGEYLGAADLVYVDDEAHVHVGAEAAIEEIFEVRAGYMFNYDIKNFTAGVSFTRYSIKIDYAFVPFEKDLGTSHMFNVTFSL